MPSREMDLARQRIHGLLAAADPGGRPRLLETHISWVLLAGDRAYKFKKPVNFGFLDFSTLPLREFYCREELRLNRRMAPDLYLGVVPVTGGHSRPSLGKADGETLDWAVCMRRFPQSAQLDNQLRAGLPTAANDSGPACIRFGQIFNSQPIGRPYPHPLSHTVWEEGCA